MRRALRNASLDLLAASGDAAAIELAELQYRTADNMTDRMAALSTLSLHDVPARGACLEHFHGRYQDDPLIIDKWFSLQASIPEAATLDRVRALAQHPSFSLANPNRVRALIGTFAHANATQFNRSDGAGYELVAETALALDTLNPQVAARLFSAFKTWRALEPSRREKALAVLERIASTATLSTDVRDIAERSLAPTPPS